MQRFSLYTESLRAFRFSGLLFACTAVLVGCQSEPSPSAVTTSSSCVTCHLAEFNGVTHPRHAGAKPTTCGTCHTEEAWHPFRLKHSFALEGAHAKLDCFKCHLRFGLTSLPSPVFEGTPKQCVKCHEEARQRANEQVKNHAAFPDTCEKCHSVNAWKPTLPHKAAPATSLPPAAPSAPSKPNPKPAATASRIQRKPASAVPKPVVITPTPAPAPTRKPDRVSGASTTK